MAELPVVGLGEILWDLLPSGKVLGGAPCNFTYHVARLGHPAVIVSRVGADVPGADIRRRLAELGLSDAFVQEDPAAPRCAPATGSSSTTRNCRCCAGCSGWRAGRRVNSEVEGV